jgi:NADH:ubiquinone oxidoreductase subunit 6 (subunit J)
VSLVVFFFAAVAALASGLAIVLQRNPFVSALALIANLASIAVLYLLLEADFVAAAQVIVYAGAVSVMFLFVIAYVGPRAEAGARRGPGWQLWAAVVAGTAIFAEIAIAVGGAALSEPATVEGGFGSPRDVGELFVTDYLLAFELVSLLLLVAAVAGVVLGAGPRPHRPSSFTAEDGRESRRLASAALIQESQSQEIVR